MVFPICRFSSRPSLPTSFPRPGGVDEVEVEVVEADLAHGGSRSLSSHRATRS